MMGLPVEVRVLALEQWKEEMGKLALRVWELEEELVLLRESVKMLVKGSNRKSG